MCLANYMVLLSLHLMLATGIRLYNPLLVPKAQSLYKQKISQHFTRIVKHCLLHNVQHSYKAMVKQVLSCSSLTTHTCNVTNTPLSPSVAINISSSCYFSNIYLNSDSNSVVTQEWQLQLGFALPRLTAANVTVVSMEMYHGNDKCRRGGLWMASTNTPPTMQSYLRFTRKICGCTHPHLTDLTYLSQHRYLYFDFNGFIFPWMKGVRLRVDLMGLDVARKIPIPQQYGFVMGDSPEGRVMLIEDILYVMRVAAPRDYRISLHVNKTVLAGHTFLDGPGWLSPVLHNFTEGNNGTVYIRTTSFILMLINGPIHTRKEYVLGRFKLMEQTSNCFTGKYTNDEQVQRWFLNVTADAAHSNIHCVMRMKKDKRIRDIGRWEAKLVYISHIGSNRADCLYGGFAMSVGETADEQSIMLRLCHDSYHNVMRLIPTYGNEIRLIYHHFKGYSLGGSVAINVDQSHSLCSVMLTQCEGKFGFKYQPYVKICACQI